jgi:hypothetical protein|tara:strand:+ start:54 stop:587 length:534 start_codon:yes stop_codon:yes gene_type:complete
MSKLYNTAKKAFFEPIKKAFKGKKGSGEAIKDIGANVPKSQLDKLTRDVKILDQKAKATKALVDQTNFEIKNPQFSKGRFTFDPNRRNVTKESVKKRNKKSEEMFEASKGRKFNKGGRVGLKRGTFPDLNKDGKTTFADVLIGRGVLPKGKKKKTMAKKSESPMDKAVKKKNKKRFV